MSTIVKLTLGDKLFTTTTETLNRSPWFRSRLNNVDSLFVDRNCHLFSHVLAYLRNGSNWVPPDDIKLLGDLRNEAVFYELIEMAAIIDEIYPRYFLYVTHPELGSYFENVPNELKDRLSPTTLTQSLASVIPLYTFKGYTMVDDFKIGRFESSIQDRIQYRRGKL
jgi:BTB/POZ domain